MALDLIQAFVFLFLMVPLAAAPIIGLIIYASTRATTSVNECRACGYDLHHLADARQCPECGRPFVVNEKGDALS